MKSVQGEYVKPDASCLAFKLHCCNIVPMLMLAVELWNVFIHVYMGALRYGGLTLPV